MTDTLKQPAADMTVQQHLAINLMIPVSGCDEIDRMIWEAKRDHIAAQMMAAFGNDAECLSDMARRSYDAADELLIASGWEGGAA